MPISELIIKTKKEEEIVDITQQVKRVIEKFKIKDGSCLIYVPHATAAVTINENYDPGVCEDFLEALRKIAPKGNWRHDKTDQNGDAHIKAAIIGPSTTIPIKEQKLCLGTWQGIMFCEFDGPRERKIIVEVR